MTSQNIKRLKKLKELAINTEPIAGILVFRCEGTGNASFLADQYAESLASSRGQHIVWEDSLEAALEARRGLFSDSMAFYTVHLDLFDRCPVMNVSKLDRILVIAKNVSPVLETRFKDSLYTFNDPERWQIVSYAESLSGSLTHDKAEWLCAECHYDLYRIDTEFRRIGMFGGTEQDKVFLKMNDEGGFGDLTVSNQYSLPNALIGRTTDSVYSALCGAYSYGADPMGFLQIMTAKFRLFLSLKLDPSSVHESDYLHQDISWAKANLSRYGVDEVSEKYDFLLSAYLMVTEGRLAKDEIIPYVITNLMEDDR